MYYIKLLPPRVNSHIIYWHVELTIQTFKLGETCFFAIFLGWCHKPEFDIVRFALCGWFASVSAGNLALSASRAIVDGVVWCGDERERGWAWGGERGDSAALGKKLGNGSWLVKQRQLIINVGTLTLRSQESSTKKVEFSCLQSQESGIILLLRTFTRRTANKLIVTLTPNEEFMENLPFLVERCLKRPREGRISRMDY